jgi:hypothetical protein
MFTGVALLCAWWPGSAAAPASANPAPGVARFPRRREIGPRNYSNGGWGW